MNHIHVSSMVRPFIAGYVVVAMMAGQKIWDLSVTPREVNICVSPPLNGTNVCKCLPYPLNLNYTLSPMCVQHERSHLGDGENCLDWYGS